AGTAAIELGNGDEEPSPVTGIPHGLLDAVGGLGGVVPIAIGSIERDLRDDVSSLGVDDRGEGRVRRIVGGEEKMIARIEGHLVDASRGYRPGVDRGAAEGGKPRDGKVKALEETGAVTCP